MPRMARKNMETQFFHVVVQGINKEYIFEETMCKEKYKRTLKKYIEENNVSIIAYCIMDNHAHILIHCKNVKDMSKYMHYINTSYGGFYNGVKNRVGFVFKNRYSSEPILDEKHLYNCIKYIHNNPVKANIVENPMEYKYSSFMEYIYNTNDLIASSGTGYEYIKSYKIGVLSGVKSENISEEDYKFIDYINSNINVAEEIEKYCKKRNIYNIVNDETKLIDMVKYLVDKKIAKIKIAKELKISRTKITKLLQRGVPNVQK